jgi:hypothetical protein
MMATTPMQNADFTILRGYSGIIMRYFPIFVEVIAFLSCCCSSLLVEVPFADRQYSPTTSSHTFSIHTHNGGRYKGYVVVTAAVWSVALPSYGDECHQALQTTSTQAKHHNCTVAATNGGPFQADGTPVGPVIFNQTIVANPHDFPSPVGFGSTMNDTWILGSLASASEAKRVRHFVSGFNWLVLNGTIHVPDHNPTGADQAPRTAVGVTRNGQLLLLVVDGCEKW